VLSGCSTDLMISQRHYPAYYAGRVDDKGRSAWRLPLVVLGNPFPGDKRAFERAKAAAEQAFTQSGDDVLVFDLADPNGPRPTSYAVMRFTGAAPFHPDLCRDREAVQAESAVADFLGASAALCQGQTVESAVGGYMQDVAAGDSGNHRFDNGVTRLTRALFLHSEYSARLRAAAPP
jgi:hypothetical protein